MQLLVGFLLALIISAAAYKSRSLSSSGAVAAAILGTVVFGLGGLDWAVLLIGFFISSSLLSHLFGKRKHRVAEEFSKGSQRDAGQVLANGGVAAIFVILYRLFPGMGHSTGIFWLCYAAALAAVNADTWGTELGVLSKRTPRLISNLKKVEPGTSGAVTLDGTLASGGGALMIAVLAAIFWHADPSLILPWGVIIFVSGLFGSLADSWLSAVVQVIYYCPACKKETERHPYHGCGEKTTFLRGLPWFGNDLVNAAGSFSAVVLAALLAAIF